MADETANPAPEAPETPPAEPPAGQGDPWREVLDGVEALASAIGRWAKSVVDNPDNQRRAEQLKERLNDVARDVGAAADKAADKIRAAAEKNEQRPGDAPDSGEATPEDKAAE